MGSARPRRPAPAGGRFETAEFRLDNTYYDTPSAHLAQFGVTLRRREGGPDAGWHLKVPAGVARNEITDSSDSATLPEELGQDRHRPAGR